MKVILKKTGEIKEVSDGYARNYLFPRGLAVSATKKAIEAVQAEQEKIAANAQSQQAQWQKLKQELESTPIGIKAKANKDGTLFGALSAAVIVGTLQKEKKVEMQPSWVQLEHPIKTTGTHLVPVHFPSGLQATFTLHVKSK